MKTIDELLANWKPQSLMSKCHQHGYTKWQVLDHIQAPVYMGKPYVGDADFLVDVRNCRLCGTELDLRFAVGHYITRKQCSCADNGTKNATLEKFLVYLNEDKAKQAFTSYNMSKAKGFATTTRSWIAKGHTEEEAKEMVRQEQAKRSAKSPASQKGATDYSIRSTGYWMTKHGMTEDEAKEAVSNAQVKNGLAWHITQYGEDEGPAKYKARMDSWNAKMAESVKTGISAVATKFFDSLDEKLNLTSQREHSIWNNGAAYRIDYLLGDKAIEFFGDYWHANPKLYEDQDLMIGGKTAKEIQDRNDRKIAALRSKGLQVLVIWEHDFKMQPEEVMRECLAFLENKNET